MSSIDTRCMRHFAVAVLAVLILGTPGWAQTEGPESATPVDFAVDAGPLPAALDQWSVQSGLEVQYEAELVTGKTTRGVDGRHMPEVALRVLLAGTGLELVYGTGTTLVLQPSFLDSIVVSGELQERDLQDSQTSASVVTGELLDTSVHKDLFDVIDFLPNVSAQGGGFGFVIRGITDSGPGNAGSAQAISVQVDGAAVPNGQALQTGATSTWDLDQVEVLRGPQSTQQGPNALSGAIILRSKDPVFAREVTARLDVASFDETRVAVAANTTLGERWALRVSAEDYQSDGDIDHLFSDRPSAEEFSRPIEPSSVSCRTIRWTSFWGTRGRRTSSAIRACSRTSFRSGVCRMCSTSPKASPTSPT